MKHDMDLGIPLPDGTRLSARVWIPDSAELEPVPAILEYLPYRKSDGTIDRDDTMHPWFAEEGYACLRVDRRGCGDSEGLYDDEYSEQELQDGEEIIAWIAKQPWCNGNVGMQGISWGGFNGLQLAARRPEALKAVISIGTTVDRFADDIHYKGGIQLGENAGWAATAGAWLSTPADPKLRPDWRETWLNRLENAPFVAERWTAQSDRSGYWKHGSVCESYDQFDAAVLVIGGQHDGYRNAMAAMVENASGVVQGIMGPWNHKYPHISTIEPRIDYLGLALRWWDRWLKGVENGADHDPAYRAYVMDSVKPDPALSERPGRWIGLPEWPSPDIRTKVLGLGPGQLDHSEPFELVIETDLAVGRASGEYFPFGFGPGELPGDQTPDDALSLCFDGPELDDDMALIGAPEVSLRLACDKARGQVIARLCDIRPDGTVALISLGMLNLQHRDGFDAKVPVVPGEAVNISFKLDQSAYRLPRGHRLRLAISNSYWPYCWPEGETFALTVCGGSLSLPVYEGTGQEISFDAPPPVAKRESKLLREGAEHKEWIEHEDGRIELIIGGDDGRREDQGTGLITESAVTERWSIMRGDPTSAEVEFTWSKGLGRGNWGVRTELVLRMRGEAEHFVIEQVMRAWDGDALVFEKSRNAHVPR